MSHSDSDFPSLKYLIISRHCSKEVKVQKHSSPATSLIKMEQMIFERDVPIPSDGINLRADVFRPQSTKRVPVIMTMGPYVKGVEYKTGYSAPWNWLISTQPDILPGSTRSFMTFRDCRSGALDPLGICCRSRGLQGLRQITRITRHAVAAGGTGLLQRNRVGRDTRLVQWQGQIEGHLVLCYYTVAGGCASVSHLSLPMLPFLL
jgi:hypothetical protein